MNITALNSKIETDEILDIENLDNFLLATLNWKDITRGVRVSLCELLGYENESEEAADENCNVALIIPRTNGVLNFEKAFLHILTIGEIPKAALINMIEQESATNDIVNMFS